MDTNRPWPRAAGDPPDVVIPWRDGGDPDRSAAYAYTLAYYQGLGLNVHVCDDGKTTGPFNRHAAYNTGLTRASTDVICWIEADTLIPVDQLAVAAVLAAKGPGLVVPFTERHELDAAQSAEVYDGANPWDYLGAVVFPDGSSIGQAGVTSRATIAAIGGRWDDRYSGWGYDDNAAFRAFEEQAGRARWVKGKGVHLWHKPGFVEPTPEQAAATARNAALYQAGG